MQRLTRHCTSRSMGRVVAGCAAALLAVVGLPLNAAPAAAPLVAASDGPGALSHFDLARKDCLGTANGPKSKIWYTVANGVLSDVYSPTIDDTNVETMQYLVTDGSTFTDLQTRDTTYTVEGARRHRDGVQGDRDGQERRATSWSPTTSPTPSRNTRRRAHEARAADCDRGTTGSTSGSTRRGRQRRWRCRQRRRRHGGHRHVHRLAGRPSPSTPTPRPRQPTATTRSPVLLALRRTAFSPVSSGFVGTASDGLAQLDAAHALTPTADAVNGNIVQTAGINLGHAAARSPLPSASAPPGRRGRRRRGDSLRKPSFPGPARLRAGLEVRRRELGAAARLPGLTGGRMAELRARVLPVSANVLKASEDKTFPGAIVAAMAAPWGQAVSAGDPNHTYFGSYREVFARDLYEAWTGLLADGDLTTARRAVRFLFLKQQQADGSMPRNWLLNGKLAPDSNGTQLDEASYPILMARQLGLDRRRRSGRTSSPPPTSSRRTGRASGSSGGRSSAATRPRPSRQRSPAWWPRPTSPTGNGDAAGAGSGARRPTTTSAAIKGWTVTTNGPLSTDPYFMRLSKTGDPNAATATTSTTVARPSTSARSSMPASSSWSASVSCRRPTRTWPTRCRWSTRPSSRRRRAARAGSATTATATATARRPTADPWAPSGQGTGHMWPVLSAERAEQALQTGGAADAVAAAGRHATLPSRRRPRTRAGLGAADLAASPYGTDPTTASIGFVNGRPAGSAAPLTWAPGRTCGCRPTSVPALLEQPADTCHRYLTHTQSATTLTVTAPGRRLADRRASRRR